MLDEAVFQKMKSVSHFNREIFDLLESSTKLRYMYNWIQWKEIEAAQYKDEEKAKYFYKIKNEIEELLNPEKIIKS